MFEAYVEMGEENIVVTDILKGFASFLVVALGGTFIGIVWGYLTGFVTAESRREIKPLLQQLVADPDLINRTLIDDILKFKRRKQHLKRQGHRQWYTELEITGING